ncbi:MAG: hypothetical protein J6B23_04595, partial [Clostridia bacterium]|nr:hypothetical protein [Clostridia bacterium]
NCLVINPDEGADHNPDSNVKIVRYETSDSGGIAVADTHELYAGKATDARRGFFCTDNRQSLVIRDEISLSGESDVYWFMQTAASVELTDSGAILTRGGKKLLLEAVADCEFEISSGRSVPLTTSPVMPNDKMPDLNRIAIKLHTSGDTSLTVKLTPYEIDGTRIIDYHKSIDEWSSDCIHK